MNTYSHLSGFGTRHELLTSRQQDSARLELKSIPIKCDPRSIINFNQSSSISQLWITHFRRTKGRIDLKLCVPVHWWSINKHRKFQTDSTFHSLEISNWKFAAVDPGHTWFGLNLVAVQFYSYHEPILHLLYIH